MRRASTINGLLPSKFTGDLPPRGRRKLNWRRRRRSNSTGAFTSLPTTCRAAMRIEAPPEMAVTSGAMEGDGDTADAASSTMPAPRKASTKRPAAADHKGSRAEASHREGSKQSRVIEMLQRTQGPQIAEVWFQGAGDEQIEWQFSKGDDYGPRTQCEGSLH